MVGAVPGGEAVSLCTSLADTVDTLLLALARLPAPVTAAPHPGHGLATRSSSWLSSHRGPMTSAPFSMHLRRSSRSAVTTTHSTSGPAVEATVSTIVSSPSWGRRSPAPTRRPGRCRGPCPRPRGAAPGRPGRTGPCRPPGRGGPPGRAAGRRHPRGRATTRPPREPITLATSTTRTGDAGTAAAAARRSRTAGTGRSPHLVGRHPRDVLGLPRGRAHVERLGHRPDHRVVRPVAVVLLHEPAHGPCARPAWTPRPPPAGPPRPRPRPGCARRRAPPRSRRRWYLRPVLQQHPPVVMCEQARRAEAPPVCVPLCAAGEPVAVSPCHGFHHPPACRRPAEPTSAQLSRSR